MTKSPEWTKRVAEWYQEIDRAIKVVPKLLLYFIYGLSMFFGLIAVVWGLWENVFPIFLVGLLMSVSPPIVHLRELIVGIFFLFWQEMVNPFFLWIVLLRKQGFSFLSTRECAIQLAGVLFTFFVFYRSHTSRMFPYVLLVIFAVVLLFFSGGEFALAPEFRGWESALVTGVLTLLAGVLGGVAPGFFVGFFTGSERKGVNSVGLGSFFAASIDVVFWTSEIFASFNTNVWGIFGMFLVLIGMIILLFIVAGFGMLCGYLGEWIGIKARRKILKKSAMI